jgi:acyl carrier protein
MVDAFHNQMVVIYHKKNNKTEVITMTNQEKIALLEDMLELEEGTLNGDIELTDVEEWDSMAKLSFIVLMDEEFNKKVTGHQIKGFKTLQDILDFMG